MIPNIRAVAACALWTDAPLIEVSLESVSRIFEELSGPTRSAAGTKIRAWIEQLI